MPRGARRLGIAVLAILVLLPLIAAFAGKIIAPGILHPQNINPNRAARNAEMLERTEAVEHDLDVRAPDGVELRGWRIDPHAPNGDWVLLFHGVSDNRTGVLGPAEFLLRHGYGVIAMDSRGHGASGGDMVTYGGRERYDTVAITKALYATESVRHLYALGVSMGGAVALESAAIEPRIGAVVAEDPFANLREVSYDYPGLDFGPLLGKTLFRPAVAVGLDTIRKQGDFNPDDVSPEKAVAGRAFAILLICGTSDHRIPYRHAERIYKAARGPKELWIVPGAEHAAAFGQARAEYEHRVIVFFESTARDQPE
jgi:alpha-beta hydrolase superfamily lysophospholipase